MEKQIITKEYAQHKIDHYAATAEGEMKVGNNTMAAFYRGKSDAWTDVYNTLFPEMEKERAYPLDEEYRNNTIDSVVFIHNISHKVK